MTSVLLILAGGLALLGVVIGARWLDSRAWARSLVAYKLRLPAGLEVTDVARWLGNIGATTHPTRYALLPLPPVVLEVRADETGISHYLLVAKNAEAQALAGLRACLPGVRIEEAPDYAAGRPVFGTAAELTQTSQRRPLAVERAAAASGALLAALQPVPRGGCIVLQWILTSAGTPAPVDTASRRPEDRWWSGYLVDGDLPLDSEAVRALRLKQRQVMLRATGRLGVQGSSRQVEQALFGRVWGQVHVLNSVGVQLVRRYLLSRTVAGRMARRALPVTRWPLLLNTDEAAGLLAMPVDGVQLPGLSLGVARQLPPPRTMPTRGAVVARSNYPKMEQRPLALSTEDRLRHTYIVGPTGSGKSVLLSRLILGDIESGYGVVAVDPKGDLITDVLDRIGDEAAERVVVVDASKRDTPIGFNVLGQAHGEEARELAVDNVVHVFKEIWSAYWGPRSDHILRAALTTLVNSRALDGSAFTLCEIVPLLTRPAFRRFVVERAALPDSLKGYWQWYDGLSDRERAQSIGPLINKAEAFTSRTAIRLLLGQSAGIDLRDVFRERRVLLVSLAKGALGSETANLLGSLLVSCLWNVTLERVQVPAERRRPVFAYIDEAQDFVRLPLAVADMLAQARGLKLGITLVLQSRFSGA